MEYSNSSRLDLSNEWTNIKEKEWIGYVALSISVVLFGLNIVPVKRCRPGDGLFFQFIMCVAILLVGVVIGAIRQFPPNYPLAMLSGFLWATSSVFIVTIVSTIGLGLGILLINSSSTINGWATGRFGLFGLKPTIPTSLTMNYVGVAMALVSTVFLIFIKPDAVQEPNNNAKFQDEKKSAKRRMSEIELEAGSIHDILEHHVRNEHEQRSPIKKLLDNLSPLSQRILGCFLAILAGCFCGQQMTSVIYILHHPEIYPNAPQHPLDYIFVLFLGIFVSGSVYFILYCAIFRDKIMISGQMILPALASGTMVGIGLASFLVATEQLSPAVTYPISQSLPGLLNSILGVFAFKEIRGCRNWLILLFAGCVAMVGAVLTGLSTR